MSFGIPRPVKVWTVAPGGPPMEADFPDIGSAVAIAASGDEIQVAPGSYTETAEWTATAKGLRIVGAGEGLVDVTWNAAIPYGAQLSPSSVIEGMTLRAGTLTTAIARIVLGASAQTFRHLRIDPGAIIGVKDESNNSLITHRAEHCRSIAGSLGGRVFQMDAATPWVFDEPETEAASNGVMLQPNGTGDIDVLHGKSIDRSVGVPFLRNGGTSNIRVRGGHYWGTMTKVGGAAFDFSTVAGNLEIHDSPDLQNSLFDRVINMSAAGCTLTWRNGEDYNAGKVTGAPTLFLGTFAGSTTVPGLVPPRGTALVGDVLRADGTWGKPVYSNVVEVEATGTTTVNGTALQAAIAGAGANTLIRVYAGSYTLPASAVSAVNSLHIEAVGPVELYASAPIAGSAMIRLTGTDCVVEGLHFNVNVANVTGLELAGARSIALHCKYTTLANPSYGIRSTSSAQVAIGCVWRGNWDAAAVADGGGLAVLGPTSLSTSGTSATGFYWEAKDGGTLRVYSHAFSGDLSGAGDSYARATGTAGSKIILNDCHVNNLSGGYLVTIDGTTGTAELYDVTFEPTSLFALNVNATATVRARNVPFQASGTITPGAVVDWGLASQTEVDTGADNKKTVTPLTLKNTTLQFFSKPINKVIRVGLGGDIDQVSLDFAIGTAVAGDLILVYPGAYTNSASSTLAGGVSLFAPGGPDVTSLQRSGAGTSAVIVVGGNDVSIDGLRVDGGGVASNGGISAVGRTGLTIDNCDVVNFTGGAYGITVTTGSSARITNLRFGGTMLGAVGLGTGSDVSVNHVRPIDGATLTINEVFGCGAGKLFLHDMEILSGAGIVNGILATSSAEVYASNVTVEGAQNGCVLLGSGWLRDCRFRNNTADDLKVTGTLPVYLYDIDVDWSNCTINSTANLKLDHGYEQTFTNASQTIPQFVEVAVSNPAGAGQTFNLLSSALYGCQRLWIVDAKGDALNNPIVINASGGQTINGAASYSIRENYGAVCLQRISGGWIVVAAPVMDGIERVVRYDITWNGGGTQDSNIVLPSTAIVTEARVNVTTVWDDAATTLDVGPTTDPDRYVDQTEIDLTALGLTVIPLDTTPLLDSVVRSTLAGGAPSQGAATVTVKYLLTPLT